MQEKKKRHPKIKSKLHPRNKHRKRYDFKLLIETCPDLKPFVFVNKFEDESIDFFDPEAVKMLNKSLLMHYYDIKFWEIPDGYLCPPIPGRADYIHYIADLLAKYNKNKKIPRSIKCLDIGVGASCIYPMIGVKEYGWDFVGTDIDPVSLKTADKIIKANPILKGKVETRFQKNSQYMFYSILKKDEPIDVCICNPPFHATMEEARAGSIRKIKNLTKERTTDPVLNFGGRYSELVYEGGEKRFVKNMIRQSREFSTSCFWFSTLISKASNIDSIYTSLRKLGASDYKTIPMGQGNKTSRIIAWTFLSKQQRDVWVDTRWGI